MSKQFLISQEQLQAIRGLIQEAKSADSIAFELENKLIDDIGIHPEFVDGVAAILRNERVLGLDLVDNDGTQTLIGLSSNNPDEGVQIASADIDPSKIINTVDNEEDFEADASPAAEAGDVAEAAPAVAEPAATEQAADNAVTTAEEPAPSATEAEPVLSDNAEVQQENASEPEPQPQPQVDAANDEIAPEAVVEAAIDEEPTVTEEAQVEAEVADSAAAASTEPAGGDDELTEEEKREQEARAFAGLSFGLPIADNANNRAVIKEITEKGVLLNDGSATYIGLPDGQKRILTTSDGRRVQLDGNNSLRVSRNMSGSLDYHLIDRASSHTFNPAPAPTPQAKAGPGFNFAAANARAQEKFAARQQEVIADQQAMKELQEQSKTAPAPGGGGGSGFGLSMLNRNGNKITMGAKNAPKASSTLTAEALGGAMLQKNLVASMAAVSASMIQYQNSKKEFDWYAEQGITPAPSPDVPPLAEANSDEYKAAIAKRAMDAMEKHQETVRENFDRINEVLDQMAESGMTFDSLPKPDMIQEQLEKMVDSLKENGDMLLGGVEMSERIKEMSDRVKELVSALIGRGPGVSNG